MDIDCCPLLSSNDYEVLHYVQEGALGKVYCGRCLSTNQLVALKFFGYTKRKPRSRYIYHEIQNLSLLKGVEGIVQIQGIFYDTLEGILNMKVHQYEYPVIVMEWFEGGALFDRIHDHRKSMSEKTLANIFKSTIQALENIHRRNIIHRDIKLENLMLVNTSENSPIKIIDFGIAVQLPEGSEIYVEKGDSSPTGRMTHHVHHNHGHRNHHNHGQQYHHLANDDASVGRRSVVLCGTAGLYAPESVLFGYYSKKTDIWQAGCALYSLLSGLLPFNPKYPEDIIYYSHYEMIGSCWDTISSHGKDLINNLLQKDSYLRYSSQEILNHCWIINSAPETILNESYFQRIQTLKLKNKLKQFFLSANIKQQNLQQRLKLKKIFPYLFPNNPTEIPSSSSSPSSSSTTRPHVDPAHHHPQGEKESPQGDSRMTKKKKNKQNIFWTESEEEEYFNYQNTKQNHEKFLNFQIKIRTMKELVLRSYFHQPETAIASPATRSSSPPSSIHATFPRSSTPLLRSTGGAGAGSGGGGGGGRRGGRGGGFQSKEMTYGDFISILLQCHLPELAQPEIFAIFDENNSGTIDIKEFLFTMLAFKQLPMHDNSSTLTSLPVHVHLPHPHSALAPDGDASNEIKNSEDHGQEHQLQEEHEQSDVMISFTERESEQQNEKMSVMAADDLETRLFFSVFDLDDSGSINIQELEFIIRSLLAEEEIEGTTETGRGTQNDDTSSPCSSSSSSSFFPSTNSSNDVLGPLPPLPSSAPPHHSNSKLVPPLFPVGSFSSDSLRTIPSSPKTTTSDPPLLMSSPSIGELFDVMDVSKNGEVDYSEFKVFYNTIISPSNTPRDSLNESST
jgi:serine/threonine protein kinase/Ca2+-binding EF-hand superfamily protein